MAAEEADVRALALEIYRLGWSELRRSRKRSHAEHVEFYLEDLKEALLDLKQATIANDIPRMWRTIAEVAALRAELGEGSEGES
jgi:hypothetical protein